jgi:hypothetical protein
VPIGAERRDSRSGLEELRPLARWVLPSIDDHEDRGVSRKTVQRGRVVLFER